MNSIQYISVIAAIFLILSAWGVQTPTLLAGAGIIGLAISFGAQSLIEDIFAGLFIIFEKQFAVGDVIQINEFRGIVKELGLRITKFEDINGDVKMINNSDIRGAINSSNALSQAICELDISYNEDIEKFEEFMKNNIKSIKDQVKTIKKGPFYDGIEKFGESGVTIRIVAWSKEIDRLHTIRELNKHVKMLFDKNNIEIPFPQVVIHKEE
jgi:small conductance mechanosensitive channel